MADGSLGMGESHEMCGSLGMDGVKPIKSKEEVIIRTDKGLYYGGDVIYG